MNTKNIFPKNLYQLFSKLGLEFLIDKSSFVDNKTRFRLSGEKRSSDVHCPRNQQLIIMDFWDKGHACGTISTANSNNFARICNLWFVENLRLSEIQKELSDIIINPIEPLIYGSISELLVYQWNKYESWLSKEEDELYMVTYQLLKLAAASSTLSNLFPYTSHHELHFTDNSGYPYNSNIPFLKPLSNEEIVLVNLNNKKVIKGKEDAINSLALEIEKMNLDIRIGL